MTNRYRDRCIAMQRAIEELADMRDQAREEAARHCQEEAAAAAAARQAQEQVDPMLHRLRIQLQEAQRVLMAATPPPPS